MKTFFAAEAAAAPGSGSRPQALRRARSPAARLHRFVQLPGMQVDQIENNAMNGYEVLSIVKNQSIRFLNEPFDISQYCMYY